VAHKKKLALLHMDVPAAVAFKVMPPEAKDTIPPVNVQAQQMLYGALLMETKKREQETDILLFNWDEPDSPNKVPGLMGSFAEAWNPHNPKIVETVPGPTPDDVPATAEQDSATPEETDMPQSTPSTSQVAQ
jgi:hypothetical protein